MSSFMAKKSEIERKWYIIDAEGKPLGRVATVVASILRGKVKPTFTPHVDTGDFVIVLNADKVVLTGKKLEQKMYYRHSGYIGGLKTVKYKLLMEKRPVFAMEKAVKGMLPKTTLGRAAFMRLKAYAGTEHNHIAQKPEVWAGEIK